MTAVAGVDEVGVGALAGPVTAAAVILAPNAIVDGLADSKLLTQKRRQVLFGVISECAVAIGIGQVEAEEVDRLNVYWAAMEARRRAVDALPTPAAHILVDGKECVRNLVFEPYNDARRGREKEVWQRTGRMESATRW